jgi:hypothetical protein
VRRPDLIRIYLPESFTNDARERDPDLDSLWAHILAYPRSRRGGGFGRWLELTVEDARSILKEAEYRVEYWLSDAYLDDDDAITAGERTAGLAAKRVAESLRDSLKEKRS